MVLNDTLEACAKRTFAWKYPARDQVAAVSTRVVILFDIPVIA